MGYGVRIAQQRTHSNKINTKNRRETIQGGILAKGFMDDFRYIHPGRKYILKALINGVYI